MSDIDTGEVDSPKALDPDGRLEKIDEKAKQAWARRHEQHCLAAIEMLDQ